MSMGAVAASAVISSGSGVQVASVGVGSSVSLWSGIANTFSVPLPTGTQVGDALLFRFWTDRTDPGVFSGWTQVWAGTSYAERWMTRQATLDDVTAGSFSITLSGGGFGLAQILGFRNANVAGISVTANTLNATAATSVTGPAPSVGTQDGSAYLYFGVWGDGGWGDTPTFTDASGATRIVTDASGNARWFIDEMDNQAAGTGPTATMATSSTHGSSPDTLVAGYIVLPVSVAPTLRAVKTTYINNVSTINATLPTGTVAGDLLVLGTGHGWVPSLPSGWTQDDLTSGSNVNGMTCHKIADATDVSNGYVTVGFSGSYYGAVTIFAVINGGAVVRDCRTWRSSGGGTTGGDFLATVYPASANSLALYFCSDRVGTETITLAQGTTDETRAADANWSSVAGHEAISAKKTAAQKVTHGGSASGFYAGVVVVSPPNTAMNDTFASAPTLDMTGRGNALVSQSNAGAASGLESGEPSTTQAGGWAVKSTVWAKFVAPITGNLLFTLTTKSFDGFLDVYTGSAVNSLSNVDGFEANNNTSGKAISVTSGTTYYVRVSSYTGSTAGSFAVEWSTNDKIATAATISTTVGSDAASFYGATFEAGEPSPVSTYSGGTVWWRFKTGATGGACQIDSRGTNNLSGSDSVLGVYTSSSPSSPTYASLTLVSGDDSTGGNADGQVTPTLSANTDYFVQLMPRYNAAPSNAIAELNWSLPSVV